MPREPVESSLIRAVGYDVPGSILEVELVEGGVVYEYFDVPYSAYAELMEAESKGAYYNDFIKDLYAFRKRGIEGERGGSPGTPEVATFGMLVARPLTDDLSAGVARTPAPSGPRLRRPNVLEREIETYRALLPEFLEQHAGDFVLIRGREVVGFWQTRAEALEVGYDRFGLVPLLAKRVLAEEPVYHFSREI